MRVKLHISKKNDINQEGHELPISGIDYLMMTIFPRKMNE
jgi:hypothetical protein